PPPPQVSITHRLCDIYKLFHEYLKLFPKEEKFSIGVKIESVILEALGHIISASYKSKYNKRELLTKASDSTDLLKITLRLAYETGSINKQKYLILEEKVVEAGKMIGGWLKSTF
ncbi:MAG: four helix bundle protein, partial [Patescibacteria group bacterium]